MQKLSIGVDSWIIQDGNYDDFAVGEARKFALEFSGKQLTSSQTKERSALLLKTSIYKVSAQVVYVDPKVWVIDFGILAFWESEPPAFAEVGSWVEGDIFIGIDPFFYKEYLHKLPNIPKLTYNWKVEGILLDDTPRLKSVNESGGITLTRDLTREAWRKVERMNAWEDDNGSASYILQCEMVNI
jgi:hypothetical protein